MIVIPYVVQKFTIAAEVARSRVCSHCGSHFVQYGELRVVGRHRTLFGVYERAAKRQARINAEIRWPEKWLSWNPPVVCPHCKCFQPEMYSEIRGNRRLWLKFVGAILIVPSFFAATLLLVIFCNREPIKLDARVLLGVAFVAVAAPIAFLFRNYTNARFDPNTLDGNRKAKLSISNALPSQEWTKPIGIGKMRYRDGREMDYDLG